MQFNGKNLNATEREEFIAIADETISGYYGGLPMITSELERTTDLHDEYHEMYRTLLSVMFFVRITMIDHIGHDKRGNILYKRDEKGNIVMTEREELIAEKGSEGNLVYRKETRQERGINDQTVFVADVFAKWKKQEGIAW